MSVRDTELWQRSSLARAVGLAAAFGAISAGCFSPQANPRAETESTSDEASAGPSGSTTAETLTEGSGSSTAAMDTGSPTSSSSGAETEETASTSTGDPIGPVACGEAGVCVAPVPSGWSGPVAYGLAVGGGRPDCGSGAYGEVVLDGAEPPQADDAECGCECGPIQELETADATLMRYHGDSSDCSVTGFAIELSVDGCNPLPAPISGGGPRYFSIDPLPIAGGSCEPASSVSVPDVRPGAPVTVCEGGTDTGGSCSDGRVCVDEPGPDQDSICIWRTGEHACPAEYPDTRPVVQGVADTRGCAECTCGAPAGAVMSSALLYADDCFPPNLGQISGDGGCHAAANLSTTIEAVPFTPGEVLDTAACAPSTPMSTGGVSGTVVNTVCCAG